jgi:hypothetical protein
VIAGLFLLISLGRHTPFYRLWYEVMPFMKSVRAPGMAFYLVALPVCIWAAIGIDRLLHNEVGWSRIAWATGIVAGIAILGAIGGLQNLANAFVLPQRLGALTANADALREGSLRLLFVATVTGIALWAVWNGMLRGALAALVLVVVVTGDLWSIDRLFFHYQPRASVIFADDALTSHLRGAAGIDGVRQEPFRVHDPGSVYQGSTLMAYRIPQLLGYHGNEVRMYDDLLGGKGVYSNHLRLNLLELLGVRYLILPGEQVNPGITTELEAGQTSEGAHAGLYEAETSRPAVRG